MTNLYNYILIEKYFEKTGYPDFDVIIRQGEKVTAENSKTFVEGMIAIVKNHPTTPVYITYFERLKTYYTKCKQVRLILKG